MYVHSSVESEGMRHGTADDQKRGAQPGGGIIGGPGPKAPGGGISCGPRAQGGGMPGGPNDGGGIANDGGPS